MFTFLIQASPKCVAFSLSKSRDAKSHKYHLHPQHLRARNSQIISRKYTKCLTELAKHQFTRNTPDVS